MKAENEVLKEIVSEIKSFHWSTVAEDDDNVKELDIENIVELVKNYHQSQLQALKEEVEEIVNSYQEQLDWGDNYEAGKIEGSDHVADEVLNLITNLEDK